MMSKWEYKKLNNIKQNEIIESIKYLYINENKSDEEIANDLNMKVTLVSCLRRNNNISRSKEAINSIRAKNNLIKYGVTNPAKLDDVKQKQSKTLKNNYKENKDDILNKRKQTVIERYGVESVMQNDKIKQRCFDNGGGWNQSSVKNTKMLKYSNPYYNNYNKTINTLKNKYNVTNVSQLQFVKDKIKATSLARYGVEFTLQVKAFREKGRKTKLEKYGDVNYVNSQAAKISFNNKSLEEKEAIINKRKQTIFNKFGVEHAKQKHLTQEEINIISSKNNLEQFIIDNNIKHFYQLEELLPNLSQSYLGKKVHEYDLDNYIELLTTTSKYELEIESLLLSNNIDFARNNRTIIHPLELDFYIPKHNLAIEFNGTYWHSSLHKDKNYHYNKSKLCEEKGIRLIHIWEYEWENERQKHILINMILSACQKNKSIYARNCNITIKQSNEMKRFFEENNIQGFRPGKFSICLEYNNEIVMAYQMGFNFFGKGKYEWEVIRGATKLGYNVIGGASKIWKYFKENYNPQSCVYYIDYNYFNGSSILNLDSNFKFIKTQPGFKNWYVEENVIKNRDPKNHSKIKELEKEGKIIPIYNSGTKVYEYNLN